MPQQLIPFWNAFKRWWWLVAICAGLAGFTAYYFASRQASVYYSSVTLRVGAGTERPDLNTLQFGGTLAEFYEKFVRLPPITRGVVDGLGLSISPEQLASQIQTRVIPLAQLLEITLFASNPEVAAELANAVGRELIDQTTPAADRALDPDYLQSELSTTRTQIDEIEARVRELREQSFRWRPSCCSSSPP